VRAESVFFVAVLSLALTAACGGPSEPSSHAELLGQNRDRFRASVGTSYVYDYRNGCFCVVDTTRQVRVSVRDGERFAVVDVESGVSVPPERWSDYLTVEEIFDAIQRAYDEGAASVRVDYDDALGYPRDAFIDFDERLADEERGYLVENLSPME
jgi:hypothetical protein